MILPEAFISRTKALLGDDWTAFEQALQQESPVSIRLNPLKTKSLALPFAVETLEKVPWASDAYYLPSRPSFTLDPLFHAGCYYVQEASSMFLEQVICKHVTQPVKVLDLCAAPGGKSTQLASVLPEGSLLVANEVIRSRASVLMENLVKWGYPDVVITNSDPEVIGKKLTAFFDVIVADLPCSGEGMFRKDAGAIREWSVNHVQFCAERQRRIVAACWQALKPGGLLVYSTCTYNREENEDNLEWICRELGAEWTEHPHRFLPHQTKGEGFFIAALKKTSVENAFHSNIHNNYRYDLQLLHKHLKVLSADWISQHALAMSVTLSRNSFPTWEVDRETALKYLRKEALQSVPPDLPKGFVLITYLNHPLGFVKNIKIRANNLYPAEWRIRMAS